MTIWCYLKSLAFAQRKYALTEKQLTRSVADMHACEAEMTEAASLTSEDLAYRFNT